MLNNVLSVCFLFAVKKFRKKKQLTRTKLFNERKKKPINKRKKIKQKLNYTALKRERQHVRNYEQTYYMIDTC